MSLSQRRRKVVGRLGRRRQREREGLVLVEGVRAVGAALDAAVDARFAIVSDAFEAGDPGGRLRARFDEAGIEVDTVEASDFDGLSDTESPQGVLLVCSEPAAEVAELCTAPGPMLVLDAIQDPGNAGTLVRSAAAFGFTGVTFLDGSVDPWSAKVVRASAGAAFHVPIARAAVGDWLGACARAERAILVASADGDVPDAVDGTSRVALVIGNEGAGVRDEIRAAAHRRVAVPMRGEVESLNAGVAGSILMDRLKGERR